MACWVVIWFDQEQEQLCSQLSWVAHHIQFSQRLQAATCRPGALSHTGVMIKRNELLLRSRATISLGSQLRDLEEEMQIIDHELKSEAAPVLNACL